MASSKAEKEPESKMGKGDGKELASLVLAAIDSEPHKPHAIVSILKGRYDQNAVLKALLALEKEGRVQRDGKKAWIAKGKERPKKEKEEK
jgi:hypothetical protein